MIPASYYHVDFKTYTHAMVTKTACLALKQLHRPTGENRDPRNKSIYLQQADFQ